MTKVHKDFLKRELEIGDFVVFPAPGGAGMRLGKIIKFTPQQIRVEWTYKASWRNNEILSDSAPRYSSQCVKVDGPDLTFYLLSGEY